MALALLDEELEFAGGALRNYLIGYKPARRGVEGETFEPRSFVAAKLRCGEIDFRTIQQGIDAGDDAARLAYDVYIHRLRKYIGGYLAVLGHTDVISFTAGVGENDSRVRRDALSGLTQMGIELDEDLNAQPAGGPRRISAATSSITVLVVPTNEELAIARACLAVL